jgi:hypothetical protein
LTGIKAASRQLWIVGGMRKSVPKPETAAPGKPAPDRPRPVRPRTLLQWILERLCMYPSAD